MDVSLAELVLFLALIYVFYRLLAPLQRRLETLILKLLLGEKRVLDAETVEPKRRSR